MKKTFAIAAVATLALSAAAHAQRDQIRVVGSSTVYPFTTTVAEQFGKTSKFKTPVVESTGTGGGLKLFCAGVGPTPGHRQRLAHHQADRDRRLHGQRRQGHHRGQGRLRRHRVRQPKKGRRPLKLTRRHIYLALAKNVPGSDGKLPPTPTNLEPDRQVAPRHEDRGLGPPPTSGTRDAFVELVMEAGCSTFPAVKAAQGGRRGVLQAGLRHASARTAPTSRPAKTTT